ncbi:thioredoxin family protein [Bacteroidota bacterium]|nr:thioredoxin family protein [Bacteroidota bacterium]
MKTKLFLVVFLSLAQINCNSNLSQKKKVNNKKIVIPESLKGRDLEGNEILLGEVNIDQLKEYTKDWSSNYNANSDVLEKIKPLIKKRGIVLIMGTWCEDSEREIPAFINILESINYDIAKMRIIAVDEDKKTPNFIEKNYELINIPTIIFYDNKNEINRIVEFPIKSIEEDMLDILSGKSYKHAYYK